MRRPHRFLWRTAFCLAALPILWCGQSRAANKDDFKLRFATVPDKAFAKEIPLLRPNQTQSFYVFVQNLSDKDEPITVEVLAGDKAIEGGNVTIQAKAKDTTLVTLGKPAVAGDKAAAPPPPPPAKPEFAELKGALKFVLHGKDADGKPWDGETVTPPLAAPANYVEVTSRTYYLKDTPGLANQLEIKVKAKDNFQGGPCRVDIALSPDRIPGFIDVPKKEGTRGGTLERPGSELTLTANNLKFRASDKPDEKTDGIVYLTIDGYQRGFIFKSTFPRSGRPESTLDPMTESVARLKVAPSADPAKPLPVELEVDNVPPEAVLELGLDRDGDGKFNNNAGEIQIVGNGARRQQLFVNPAFPSGALQLKSVVADWSTNLDVAEIFGPRLVRFRVLTSDAETAKDKDDDKTLIRFTDAVTGKADDHITQTVIFDGTKPEDIKFVNWPEKLARGSSLRVEASGVDPESGIKEVVFYVGKPVEGKMPPMAIMAVGKADAKTGTWVAMLDAPTDMKGNLEVTAQFTNNAGLVATETQKIQLVDPLPGGGVAGGKTSIKGKVLIGELGQPKVPVQLRDASGAVKDTTTTDKDGAYEFKDMAPGTYRVFASKTGNNTKGEKVVDVKGGETKDKVDVSLTR